MIIVVDNTHKKCRHSPHCNRLLKMLTAHNTEYKVVKNMRDAVASRVGVVKVEVGVVKAVILTGSEKLLSKPIDLEEIAHCMYILMHFPRVPVLGICFGAQVMHILHGGSLQHLSQLQCGKMPVYLESHPLFAVNGKHENVRFCYNDQMVKPNMAVSKPIAYMDSVLDSMKGRIPCGFQYTDGERKCFGILFHPEYYASTHYIILNFLKL